MMSRMKVVLTPEMVAKSKELMAELSRREMKELIAKDEAKKEKRRERRRERRANMSEEQKDARREKRRERRQTRKGLIALIRDQLGM